MAAAETAKLVATLDLQGNFIKNVGAAQKKLVDLSGSIAKSRAVAVGLGVGLERAAEKGISALGGAIADGIDAALTLEKAQAQTQAVIESTGHAAGVSAEQVRALAESLEDVTTADDKTIQQGENLLLTFTKIGKDIFPEAARAATNMAIAFNKGDAATADIDGAAIQLGKALNDPAAGFAALKRSGVSFSEAQIKILKGTNALTKEEAHHYIQLRKSDKAGAERYKKAVLANKLLKSQKLILAELNTEFGKAGEAAGKGFAADINRANDAIEDAKVAIAQGLIPAVGEVARELSTTLKDPAVQRGLKDLGVGLGAAIKSLVAFAKTVPWSSIATSLQAAAGFAKDLLNAFLGLPDWVKTAVITGWGLNKLTGGALNDLIGTLASGLIKGVLGINAGVVNVNAASVTGPGGLPVGPSEGPGGLVGLVGLLRTLALPVTIAAVTIGAAKVIADAIDPTAGPGPDREPLFNRDPRRFNQFGQVIQNSVEKGAKAGTEKGVKLLDTFDRRKPGAEGGGKGSDAPLQDSFDRRKIVQPIADSFDRAVVPTTKAIENTKAAVDDVAASTVAGAASIGRDVFGAGTRDVAATYGAAGRIIGALGSLPVPKVTVNVDVTGTTIERRQTIIERGGSPATDRTSNLGRASNFRETG